MKSLFVTINGFNIDKINKVYNYALNNEIDKVYILSSEIGNDNLDRFISCIPTGIKTYVFLNKNDSYQLSFDRCREILNDRKDIYIITSIRNNIYYLNNKIMLINDFFDKDEFLYENLDEDVFKFYITKSNEFVFNKDLLSSKKTYLISISDESLILELDNQVQGYIIDLNSNTIKNLF